MGRMVRACGMAFYFALEPYLINKTMLKPIMEIVNKNAMSHYFKHCAVTIQISDFIQHENLSKPATECAVQLLT